MAITFESLKANAKIFEELSKNPEWWKRPKMYGQIPVFVR
jgi:hypothetical protein